MSETLDRRQQKTRAALHAAFRDLLLARGYEALTVGDVALHANVGRSTFYEHYRTMDDLLRASLARPFAALAQLVDTQRAPDALPALAAQLQHFHAHRQVARVLLAWPARPVLASALAELVTLRLCALPPARPVLPPALLGRQVAEMQLVLLDAWIGGRPALGMDDALAALARGTRALVQALALSE